ncbi:disulfide bond formation protein DsbA [Candidatus Woesearchaeota archaeon CG10_big_fil_rev_8_21_14_0_10_37_12]|nr:MAG: disulfide bond formation protein DsbA [Candidatus Woesearchaeota archaeon CG10_big_fil_rev_8_21_14_0_10_37_12]
MKKSNDVKLWLLGLQTVLLIVLVVQLTVISDKLGAPVAAPSQPTPTPSAPSVPEPADIDMAALVDDDAVKGNEDAPVTMVEFSDFECPFCTRFFEQTLPQIESEYIETGKLKLVYRDYPLPFHPQAQKAAEAAECAGEQGKYWEMHDKLFETGVAGGVDSFKKFAKDLGLKTADFNSCLDSDQFADEVQKDMADGSAAGVQGTPGFIINGRLVSGAQPFAAFKQVIDAALAE